MELMSRGTDSLPSALSSAFFKRFPSHPSPWQLDFCIAVVLGAVILQNAAVLLRYFNRCDKEVVVSRFNVAQSFKSDE